MNEFQIVFTILGLFPLLYGAYSFYIWVNLQNWPIAAGKVKGSRLEKMLGTKYGSSSRNMSMSSTYIPYVRYEYEVDEKTYSSKNIKVGLILLSMPFMAEKMVDRYPVHSGVDVRYNPRRPKLAYLETDMGIGVWINILAGMFFLIAAQSI